MIPQRAAVAAVRAGSWRPACISRCSTRSYATPAGVDSKPPIPLFGVDGTYANALYTASVKTSSLDNTAKSLSALSSLLKEDKQLPQLIATPSLSDSDKSLIVSELHKHTGGADKGNVVQNLLQTLADNNRLGILEEICDKFAVLVGASRGEIELVITSATKLDARTLQKLEAAVGRSEHSQGKKLKVVPKINPDIQGGLIVEIGDQTIDLSVASKISKMNKLLVDSV